MLYVRPARLADTDAIAQMARNAQPVLHSLPHERTALEARIALSEDSFRADVDFPGEEVYLFVLEDSATGQLLGTSSLIASAGYDEPFYAFRNDALVHASRELRVNRKVHALTMSHELTGKSRLAGFYIDPSLRDEPAAHLMSRARMMYVAMNRRRFTPEVFSLLLGVTDDAGVSPFWEAVGRKFFGRDFKDIELVSGGRSRTFIAEVMPSYPIYVPLLPDAAQRVLGEPDPSALLAYEIHMEEGFEPDRFVDIFDAGPVITTQVDATTSVAGGAVRVVREVAHAAAGPLHLVASNRGGEFRCTLATLPRAEAHRPGAAPLDAAARAVLDVLDGDVVRAAALRRDFAATESETESMGDAR